MSFRFPPLHVRHRARATYLIHRHARHPPGLRRGPRDLGVAPARIQQPHRAVGAPRDDDAAIVARGHVGDARARRGVGRRRRMTAGAGPGAGAADGGDGVRRDDLHVAM